MLPDRDNPDFGNQVKRHREKAGLSRFALAEKVGCSDAFISMIERGKSKPGPDIHKELVKLFNGNSAEAATRVVRDVPFRERAEEAGRQHLAETARSREVASFRELTLKASEALSLETLIQMIFEKGYDVTITKRS